MVDVEDAHVLVPLMMMIMVLIMAKVRDTLGIVLNGKTYRPAPSTTRGWLAGVVLNPLRLLKE